MWIDNNLPGICDLAIEEEAFVPQYHKVWPNPMTENGFIGYTLFDSGEVTFELFDLSGRAILKHDFGYKTTGEHANTLEMSELSEGNYFYILKRSGFQIGSGKIIMK